MKNIKTISIALAFLTSLIIAPLSHAEDSPVGTWKNIDDKTGKPRGIIVITEVNGEFIGKIEKIFPEPNEEQNPKCVKCEGANKDKPVIGMTILYGLKKEGDEYTGGKILDPDNGVVYSCKLTVIDQNKKLKVRGFIGVPFLGRSQVWLREK